MRLKIIAKLLWVIVIILGLLGFILLFFTLFNRVYFNTSFIIDPELASKFGSFFGGLVGTLFAVTSTFLILVTIIKQNIENKKSQTSSNFFKMLDFHYENVNQLSIPHIDPTKKDEGKIEGRRAFVIFKLQIKELLEIVNKINDENKMGLSQIEVLDIVYTAFYYGIDAAWTDFTKGKLSKYKRGEEIAQHLLTAKENNPKKIGRTNQTSLSGYFRNIYNAVKLVDQDRYLDLSEKKQLIRILRAQLSNPELYVFFFDIMSRFGKKWRDNGYIERYELIKNVPLNYLEKYNPKDYFKFDFEEDEIQ